MLFDQDHIHPHTFVIPTLGIRNHTYAFHSLLLYENQSYLSSYFSSKERHGLRKRENKEQKALVVKERERERRE